jgi:tetratricopeptide (TPR) repeat protein
VNRVAVVAAILVSSFESRADQVVHPDPEVSSRRASVDLPAIPDLQLPKLAGSAHSPIELQLAGGALLGSRVTVRGYIIYIYDCVAELRMPGESLAAAQHRVDDDPTLCFRPKFYIADRRDARQEDALWVVSVPRAPNKLERERLPKEELANRPPVPKLALGDYVEVTGDFELNNGRGDSNSDGLVVYASLNHLGGVSRVDRVAAPTERSRPQPQRPAARAITPPAAAVQTDSVRHANAGIRAYGLKQPDLAIDEFTKAIALWADNALAWYGLGGTQAEKRAWSDAATAFDHAVAIAPDEPMYNMWSGVARYEAAMQAAREDQARKLGVPPDHFALDTHAIGFDAAEDRLATALLLVPDLWRAHYYLGKAARENGRWHTAAEDFTAAIRANPRESGPWLALAKLYETWQLPDLALAVATTGTTTAAGDVSGLWFVRGLALEDKGQLADAVKAYTEALAANHTLTQAKFLRGRVAWRLKDYKTARTDFTELLAVETDTFAAGQARIFLAQLPESK